MDRVTAALIRRSTRDGEIDERLFLREQGRLAPAARHAVRADPALARRLFGVPELEPPGVGYGFWDTTTVSLRRPLAELVADGARVLEIGPGPAATLSLYLHHAKRGLRQVCAEVHLPFLASARRAAALSGAPLEIIHSDMVANVAGEFDVIFMNPPYVPPATLRALEVRPGTAEYQAGHGGGDGGDVVGRFVREAPAALAPDGVALLGVNTFYLSDARVLELVAASPLRLVRRYFGADEVANYSQVYVLGRR